MNEYPMVSWLSEKHQFPPIGQALKKPNGLLAAGGDLSKDRLLSAYKRGIFPWFTDPEPILWWSPDPRLVIYPQAIKISKSLNKIWKKNLFRVTMDQSFYEVIQKCREPRKNEDGTWISRPMVEAYLNLHNAGYAHSVEVWHSKRLVGGLYGVAIGRAFFGESMFSDESNCSKIALVALARWLTDNEFGIIDCQVDSDHMRSMGGVKISRQKFAQILASLVTYPTNRVKWVYQRGDT